MSKFSYFALIDDWIEDLAAGSITVLSEDSNYPKTKQQSIPMADTSRATDPGGGIKIRFNLGGNKVPGLWTMLNHNIASGNPVIKSYSDAFVTLDQSQAITFREFDMYLRKINWTARTYWEWDLAGCTFKNTFAEWGKITAGLDVTTVDADISLGVDRGESYRNIHNETAYGVIWSHIIQERIQRLGVRWSPGIKSRMLDFVLAMIRSTSGGAYPLVIILDTSQAELFYMRAADTMSWRESYARSLVDDCVLEFVEMSRGKITIS